MQNSFIDPLFLNLVAITFGVIVTFVGIELFEETIKMIEKGEPSNIGRKMELLYREKRTRWYMLSFGLIVIGWFLVVVGVYGSSQLILLIYPELIIESTIPWILAILIGVLIVLDKARIVKKIPVSLQSI